MQPTHLLTRYVKNLHGSMKKYNPLFTQARDGRLTPAQVAYYLENIRHLVSHTPVYLAEAARVSKGRGDTVLEQFFIEKITEESGHDAWAEADLQKLCAAFSLPPPKELSLALQELLLFLKAEIRREPALYLSYMLLTELFTVLAAPEWVSDLQKYCGIQGEWMSVLLNHVELDKEHIQDDLKVIGVLLKNSDLHVDDLLAHMETVTLYLERFYAEVTRA